ncbi:MAG: right-handed parallel beta-helix repeat-containing protein [Trueperaceae bacterium]|nr:right-handed parallel beta-helix repeat-containing protein [Trueperaceae bacterium]
MMGRRARAKALLLAGLLTVGSAAAQGEITSVEQLRAAGASGGTFTLPAGSIFIDEPVVVTSELTIAGVGANDSILIVRGARAGLIVQPGASLTLTGLWVDGGPADTPGGADLIQTAGRLVIRESRVAGGRFEAVSNKPYGVGSGVYVAGSGVATLINVSLERNALAAVEVAHSATIELASSFVRNNVNGILVEDDARATLIQNYVHSNVAIGLIVRGQAVASVANNTFEANGRRQDENGVAYDGVRIGGSAQVTLANNHFNAIPRFGLSVYGTATIMATGNHFEASGGFSERDNKNHSALLVSEEASYSGQGERFNANPGGALELDGNARVSLTGAIVRGTGSSSSIFLDDTSTLTLVDADIEGSEGPIVVWSSSRLDVQGGRFVGSTGHAFYLGGGESSIQGAEITGSGGVAVRVSLAAAAAVHDSLIANNRSGIVFLDDSRGDVRGNRIENNQSNGIAFADATSGAAVGNTVVHTPTEGAAIYVGPGLNVTLEGNTESLP